MSRSGGGRPLRLPVLLEILVHGLHYDALRRTPLLESDNLECSPCLRWNAHENALAAIGMAVLRCRLGRRRSIVHRGLGGLQSIPPLGHIADPWLVSCSTHSPDRLGAVSDCRKVAATAEADHATTGLNPHTSGSAQTRFRPRMKYQIAAAITMTTRMIHQ